MPPFSSGFGASLGAGVVQGAVESEERHARSPQIGKSRH